MTDFTFISSADNEKIKLYKRLSADKKLRRKEQLFTVEGARLTADAAAEARPGMVLMMMIFWA